MHTGGICKSQFMLTARAQLTNIVAIENIGMQIGEVNGFRTGPVHPPSRADLMSDESRPNRFSDHGCLEEK